MIIIVSNNELPSTDLEIYPADEAQAIGTELNLTLKLPPPSSNMLDTVSTLQESRGFHLNTLLGRMFMKWSYKRLFPRFDLVDQDTADFSSDEVKNTINLYRDVDTGKPNKKYQAAYDIWKDYIKAAVSAVPIIKQTDINTATDIDVLSKARELLNTSTKDSGNVTEVIGNMQKSYKIYTDVNGTSDSDAIRNYANFMELLMELFPEHKEYEDKARDYWSEINGDGELPDEANARLVKDMRDSDVPRGNLEENKFDENISLFVDKNNKS